MAPDITFGSAQTSIPVIAVGVTGNGLIALKELLTALPADSGIALMLADPALATTDAELKAWAGPRFSVSNLQQDMNIAPNHIYCLRYIQNIALSGNRWQCVSSPSEVVSITELFTASARARGPAAIGILCGASAEDNKAGIDAIVATGGLLLATELAAVPSMKGAGGDVRIVESASAMPYFIAKHLAPQSPLAPAVQPDAQKSRFLSFANHDLRQPLQTLQLLTSTIGRKTADPAILRLVEKQGMVLDSMKHLLNSLIDLCRIEAGQIAPDIDRYAMAELLGQMTKEFSAAAQSRGLLFKVRPCTVAVQTDGQLLGKLVRQLISNALRNTERGKVLLACRMRGERLRIEVWDTGQGAAESEQARIREMLALPGSRRVEGIDLSLTYIRQLAHLLHVRMEMDARADCGSRWAFELPLSADFARRCPSPVQDKAIQYRGPADALVLLVDNDDTLLNGAGALFKQLGLQVVKAGSEVEAFARLQDSGGQPDLIIADFRLAHGETGLEVIEGVRKMLDIKIPAILVTGDGLPPAADNLAARGYMIMNKPIDVEELVTYMNKALVS